jgi:hypothetical protein
VKELSIFGVALHAFVAGLVFTLIVFGGIRVAEKLLSKKTAVKSEIQPMPFREIELPPNAISDVTPVRGGPELLLTGTIRNDSSENWEGISLTGKIILEGVTIERCRSAGDYFDLLPGKEKRVLIKCEVPSKNVSERFSFEISAGRILYSGYSPIGKATSNGAKITLKDAR